MTHIRRRALFWVDNAAQALRGDGPLGAYLLTQWAPLLRQAGFKVRSRPSSEFPWCVFTGKVLRVHVHCTVRRSRLTVSVTLSPGGKAMPQKDRQRQDRQMRQQLA